MAGIERPLGDLEFTYWLMDLASRTHFTVWADIKGFCHTSAELSRALRHVASRHPLMTVRIGADGKGKMAFLLSGQPVPFRVVPVNGQEFGQIEPDDGIGLQLDNEQNQPIDWETGPLLRAKILQFPDGRQILMLTFHHAIADGRSAMNILYEVLSALDGNDLCSRDNEDLWPQEHHLPVRFRGFSGLKGLISHSVGQSMNRLFVRPLNVPVPGYHWPDQRVDHFLRGGLDTEETRRLILQASKTNVGVHGALCCAQLLSLLDEYPSRTSLKTWILSLVDLRSRVTPPVPDSELKLMMSMTEFSQKVTRRVGFWELAGDISTKVKKAVAEGQPYRILPAQARLIRMAQCMVGNDIKTSRSLLRLGQLTRPLVMPVSNIGIVDYPSRYRLFSVDSMAFVVPLSSSGIWGSAANTFNGRLNWNFSYATPTVTKDQALRMAHRSLDILRNSLG